MINIKPDFFSSFSCTADKCNDNCCIGWEIDIDEKTLIKYRNTDGEIRNKLENSISFEESPHFILSKDERCPFLNGRNLCSLIISCGEDYLCEICREHPRFYEWYGDYRDCGLGLCCEEACRLLFSSEEPLKFIKEEDGLTDDNGIENSQAQNFFEIRERLFKIISDRRVQDLSERIKNCCDYISSLQKSFGCKSVYEIKDSINAIYEIMKLSEPYDEKWTEFISSFSFDNLSKKSNKTMYDYERLFSYFVFRHFIKAVFDRDLITHFKVCILLLITELLYEKSNSSQEKTETVRYVSKQFEYSDSNINLLEFECADNRFLSFENLTVCLDYLL